MASVEEKLKKPVRRRREVKGQFLQPKPADKPVFFTPPHLAPALFADYTYQTSDATHAMPPASSDDLPDAMPVGTAPQPHGDTGGAVALAMMGVPQGANDDELQADMAMVEMMLVDGVHESLHVAPLRVDSEAEPDADVAIMPAPVSAGNSDVLLGAMIGGSGWIGPYDAS